MKKAALLLIGTLLSAYSLAQTVRFDAVLGKERKLRLDVVAPIPKLKSDFFMTLENNVSRMRYNVMPLKKGNWYFGVGAHYFQLNELDGGPTIRFKNDKVFNETNIYVLTKRVFNKTHVNFKQLELDVLAWYQLGGNYLVRPGITYWKDFDKFKAGIGIEGFILNIDGILKKTIGVRASFKL